MLVRKVDPANPLPRYEQVYQSLVERMRLGEFPVGAALPAERQLAEDYGVSRITIVKALSKLEEEKLIERQHGRGTFVLSPSDSVAPGATNGPERSIAFLAGNVGHLGNPILYEAIMGIARVATAHQYRLQLAGPYDSSEEERDRVRAAVAGGVAGLIVWPHTGYQNAALYRELQQRRFPVVMVDRYYPEVATDYVVFDDEAAGYELTSRLISKGHRRIAALPHSEVEVTSVRHRLQGYRRALEAHGVEYDERLIWLDLYSTSYPVRDLAEQEAACRARLSQRLERDGPTALFAISLEAAERVTYDLMAMNAERIVASRPTVDPEIATISSSRSSGHAKHVAALAVQSGDTLGARAGELLLARLQGTLETAPQRITVPMEVVSTLP